MAPTCRPCAELTIDKLYLLTEEEYSGCTFPTKAYYKHHPTFGHLEQAANDGCDFCRLILDCFKGAERDHYTWPPEWEGLDADLEWSMYAAAKRLDVSDVKLALDSSTAISSEKGVCAFDVMMVQVGRRSEVEDEDGDDHNDPDYWDQRVPPLRLTLSTSRSSTTKINGFQIGRNQLDPDLGSDLNHEIARGWLKECREAHPGCMPSEPPELPTRVVDVGTSDINKARIIHSHGLKADYIALSHCWGGHISTTLTSSTASQFQHALPPSPPANFRDAITIARQLGIRYLWIDSLCILQDSPADWALESQKMARVYGDATLTLSAIAARDSTVGLLVNHRVPTPQPPPVTLRIHPSDSNPAHHVLIHLEDPSEECLRTLTNTAPLSLRGWTLQESILSPRTLFYGARQIYWECPETYHSADGLCVSKKAPQSQFPHISRLLYTNTIPQDDKAGSLLEDYYTLVAEYSGRALTYPSDKFPAFSGVARRLQPALRSEYLAGLWRSDIHRGLLWVPEIQFAPHARGRAPSWSWAVTDERVRFEFTDPRDAGWAERGSGVVMGVRTAEVVLAGAGGGDGFGQVVSGRLVVETRMVGLVRSEQRAYLGESDGRMWYDEVGGRGGEWAFRNLVIVDDGDGEGMFVVSVGMDVLAADRGKGFKMDLGAEMERGYFLMLVHADEEGVEVGWRHASTKCLVVRRVEGGTEEFERVGAALVYNTESTWLESWRKCVVTLV
ncbi:HET-domain-containing protein [Podospora conica]|nr:HET-domain-containing protein [Schizothecium conicum]